MNSHAAVEAILAPTSEKGWTGPLSYIVNKISQWREDEERTSLLEIETVVNLHQFLSRLFVNKNTIYRTKLEKEAVTRHCANYLWKWSQIRSLSEENWTANRPRAVWKVIHLKEPNLFISLLMLKRGKNFGNPPHPRCPQKPLIMCHYKVGKSIFMCTILHHNCSTSGLTRHKDNQYHIFRSRQDHKRKTEPDWQNGVYLYYALTLRNLSPKLFIIVLLTKKKN